MARSYRFVQVDVFTNRRFGGNPLAVFLDGRGLKTEEMQEIAKEMNLSETTFVFPSVLQNCAAKVRIFTPGAELPFAGHPTIGTAFVLAQQGMLPAGVEEIHLEEGIGPVAVRLEGHPAAPHFIWMSHRDATFGPMFGNRAEFAAVLGLGEMDLLSNAPIQVVSTGVPFLFIPLKNRATVDRAEPNLMLVKNAFRQYQPLSLFVFAPDEKPGQVYSRMFAGHTFGIPEDPATGGASGPLGAYLAHHGLVNTNDQIQIVSEQGTKMGRQSFIHIRLRYANEQASQIEIGGSVVPVLQGELNLD
jgi:trans-2,3-dihydro-3-hydroxyanthranilate isomerase